MTFVPGGGEGRAHMSDLLERLEPRLCTSCLQNEGFMLEHPPAARSCSKSGIPAGSLFLYSEVNAEQEQANQQS